MTDPGFPPIAPVTPEEAAEHCAVLDRELGEYIAGRKIRFREERRVRRAAVAAEPEAAAQVVQLVAAECEPAPADFSAGAGLTPAARSALMASAKARAIAFAAAVRSGNAQAVQRLSAGMNPEIWRALAIVLAEAADPSRLLAVTHVPDDGLPAHLSPEGRTHAA